MQQSAREKGSEASARGAHATAFTPILCALIIVEVHYKSSGEAAACGAKEQAACGARSSRQRGMLAPFRAPRCAQRGACQFAHATFWTQSEERSPVCCMRKSWLRHAGIDLSKHLVDHTLSYKSQPISEELQARTKLTTPMCKIEVTK